MEVAGDFSSLLSIAAIVFALLIAIIAFNRSEAKRVASPRKEGHPTALPGFWPSGVKQRYAELDEKAKQRWWRRYNSTMNVVLLIFFFGAIAAVVTQSLLIAAVVGSLIFFAMAYALSG